MSATAGVHRVGLFGLGRIGLLHAKTITESVRRLQIVKAADPSAEARAQAAGLGIETVGSWEAVIEDPSIEAVLVCSATPAHEEQLLAAASAGKQIFCEKPVAASLEAARRAVEAAEKAGVVLQVGFNRRFDPGFAEIRRRLAEGALGQVLTLRITSRDPEPPHAGYPRGRGGFFSDTMVHDFDMARFILGEDPVELSAFASAGADPLAAPVGDVDTATVILRFPSGALGGLEACRVSAPGYDQRVEVHGTAGDLRAENLQRPNVVAFDVAGEHRPPFLHFFLERYAEAFRIEMERFADALEGAPPLVTGRDGIWAMVIAELATLSAEEHRVVAISDPMEG
jgi:myo-inositol 2-dehydrogenase/D-chiro-inositol 1-dehydrogenase